MYQAEMSNGAKGGFESVELARKWAEEFGDTADHCSITDASGDEIARHVRDRNGNGRTWFAAVPAAEKHYVYGAGMVGCLYDMGPHTARTREDAIESILGSFDDLSKRELKLARTNLNAHGIHYFSPGVRVQAGADYCEITEQAGPCPDDDD